MNPQDRDPVIWDGVHGDPDWPMSSRAESGRISMAARLMAVGAGVLLAGVILAAVLR